MTVFGLQLNTSYIYTLLPQQLNVLNTAFGIDVWSSTLPPLISNLWGFGLLVTVFPYQSISCLSIKSFPLYTMYSSIFFFLISSLWALVFWSLSLLIRVKAALNIPQLPLVYYLLFNFFPSHFQSLGFGLLVTVFPYKGKVSFRHQQLVY